MTQAGVACKDMWICLQGVILDLEPRWHAAGWQQPGLQQAAGVGRGTGCGGQAATGAGARPPAVLVT